MPPPDHIEEGHVLHHVGSCDENPQNDTRLAAINQIVVAVAQVHTVAVLAHQHRSEHETAPVRRRSS